MSDAWWIVIVLVAAAVVAALLWRPTRRSIAARPSPLAQAKRRFHAQRERLEAKFLRLAATRAAADTPRWTDCNFADDVAYVRSRTTGELSAFVAITLATEEAEHQGQASLDDEGVQAGTAVFRFDRDHWETDGRAILNLSPNEAIHYYRDQLEIVGEELAHHS
ncbi:MAG: hypothetical protein LLG00_09815 [Planctomycetaceae bacterium]|nr:hypothetical protein [Planctomycetaceae bacterium]